MSAELVGITLLGCMLAVQAIATVLGLRGIGRILERVNASIADMRKEMAAGFASLRITDKT